MTSAGGRLTLCQHLQTGLKRSGVGGVGVGGLLHAYINEHTWTELHVMRAYTQHRWNNSKVVVFFLGNLAKT